jgi:hypothetical protein
MEDASSIINKMLPMPQSVEPKHKLVHPWHIFWAGARIAFIAYNNFGYVCVPIKVSALLRYAYSFCTACSRFYCSIPYVCMEHNVCSFIHIFKYR